MPERIVHEVRNSREQNTRQEREAAAEHELAAKRVRSSFAQNREERAQCTALGRQATVAALAAVEDEEREHEHGRRDQERREEAVFLRNVGRDAVHGQIREHAVAKGRADIDRPVEPVKEAVLLGALLRDLDVELIGAKHDDVGLDPAGAERNATEESEHEERHGRHARQRGDHAQRQTGQIEQAEAHDAAFQDIGNQFDGHCLIMTVCSTYVWKRPRYLSAT